MSCPVVSIGGIIVIPFQKVRELNPTHHVLIQRIWILEVKGIWADDGVAESVQEGFCNWQAISQPYQFQLSDHRSHSSPVSTREFQQVNEIISHVQSAYTDQERTLLALKVMGKI